jgi:quinol monooxygenase YgiN
MRLSISLLLAISLLPAMALTPGLVAPDAHAQDAAVYVVSYVEVAPAASATAASLLRKLADAARKDDGALRFEILERVAVPNQFAIVAIWRDQKAYDAYAASPHSKEFRDKIKAHLISAIDDRQHRGMETAGAQIKGGPGAVFVVTHVDVPPPQKDDCISALKTLVGDSRKEAGAVRFEVFQQMSRPNHFSVVEIWKDRNAYDAHITAEHTRKFREQLTPMSGALYDERLYKAL